jgi:alkylation response protein AidB-like acyl-CoA dehydrogenase
MSFALDAEQRQFSESLQNFFSQRSPSSEVRRLIESAAGWDPDVWAAVAEQLGLPGVGVPEEYGGSGYTLVEQALAFEQMGSHLLCSPYFSTVGFAAPLILASGDPNALGELMPAITSGQLIATVAIAEDGGWWDVEAITTTGSRSADGWFVDGTKSFVTDGDIAKAILVVARTDSGPGIFLVDASAPGLERTRLATLDMTRRQARLTFTRTPARLIGSPTSSLAAITYALSTAAVALAAESVGGAQRCLDMAIGYAKTRIQFGRQIGSFQAIKHKCADMLMAIESARATAYHAAWTAAYAPAEFSTASSVAKAFCSDAFIQVATESIQIHGGIGFTWEHDAQLYYRRAYSNSALLGDADFHRARLWAQPHSPFAGTRG